MRSPVHVRKFDCGVDAKVIGLVLRFLICPSNVPGIMDKQKPDYASSDTVRRSNETIAIAPKIGRITTVVRRLFNAMLYAAQQDGQRTVYRRPLGELARLAQFGSMNRATLKEHLSEMRETSVIWTLKSDDENRWAVSGLVSEVEIIEQRGHGTFIEWSLPPKISAYLLDPQFYTRLSMQIHSSLRSGASIALYEICSRYATSPRGLTCREPWEWWRPRITGNPAADVHPEYRYFKRDVLNVAIREVNALADIAIELIEGKVGKRIVDLQFKVTQKESAVKLVAPDAPHDGALLERIIRLGIAQTEARVLYSEHDPDYLKRTVELTEQRASDTKSPSLKSKAAYFKRALADRYADARENNAQRPVSATAEIVRPDPKSEVRARFVAHRGKQALELYREIDTAEQTRLRDQFAEETNVIGYKAEIRKRALTNKSVESAFGLWYADHVWGPATDEDLLDFMLKEVATA